MKRALIIFMLSLFVSPVLMADEEPLVYFTTPDTVVFPGETIPISIFSTLPTSYIQMDRISDGDAGIAGNLYLNSNYGHLNSYEGIEVNSGGILIEDVIGILETATSPLVSGELYSFDYTVSENALHDEIISIFTDPSGDAINQVYVIDEFYADYITPDSLSLTVWVPEPCTIYLLGMGALALRARKRIYTLSD